MTFLDFLLLLLLAVVQGIAEILPISSSGHLALLQALLNINEGEEAFFALLLHLGSFVAVVVYFFPLLLQLFFSLIAVIKGQATQGQRQDMRLIIYVILATIPAAVAGVLLQDTIQSIFQSLWIVGLGFWLTALLLYTIYKRGDNLDAPYHRKGMIFAGFAQVLGLLPGVSRSGITITGGQLGGLNFQKAKAFAFLLFIPIMFGSLVFSLNDGFAPTSLPWYALVIPTVVAMGVTWWSLKFVLNKLKLQHLPYFSLYLLGAGLVTLLIAFL